MTCIGRIEYILLISDIDIIWFLLIKKFTTRNWLGIHVTWSSFRDGLPYFSGMLAGVWGTIWVYGEQPRDLWHEFGLVSKFLKVLSQFESFTDFPHIGFRLVRFRTATRAARTYKKWLDGVTNDDSNDYYLQSLPSFSEFIMLVKVDHPLMFVGIFIVCNHFFLFVCVLFNSSISSLFIAFRVEHRYSLSSELNIFTSLWTIRKMWIGKREKK